MVNGVDLQEKMDGYKIVCPGIRIPGCCCLENLVKEAVWNGQKQSGPHVIPGMLKGMSIDAARLSKLPRLCDNQGVNDTDMPARAKCSVMGKSDEYIEFVTEMRMYLKQNGICEDACKYILQYPDCVENSDALPINYDNPSDTRNNCLTTNCFSPVYTQSDSVAVDYIRQNDNLTDSMERIHATINYIERLRPETPSINHDYVSSNLDCDEYTFSNYDRIISNFVDSSQPNFSWDTSIEANSFSPTYTHGDSVAVDHTDQHVNLTDSIEGIPANISYIGLMRPETAPINHDYISSDSDCDDSTCSTDGLLISNSANSSQPNDTWNNSVDANSIRPTCIQKSATVAYNNDGDLSRYTPLNIENNEVLDLSRKCTHRLVPNRRTNTSRLNRIMMKNNIKLHISESGKRTIIRNVSKTTTKNTKNIHAKRRKPFSSKFIHG